MKIKYLLIAAALTGLIVNVNAQSPDWAWAKGMGGIGHDYCYSIAVDHAGNGDVYATGFFQGTFDFNPGPGIDTLTAGGDGDIFILKLDASGNFLWVKQMGSISVGSGDAEGYSIAVDPSGSGAIYTTGYFEGTVDFDPGPGSAYLTSAGGQDIFISKLDTSGNFIWARRMGGGAYDFGYAIAIDPLRNGDIYTTGSFTGVADFDPGAVVFNLTSVGNEDIFISKLDSSGNFVWAKQLGGALYNKGRSIAIDPSGGEVYTLGYFEGTSDFDPGNGMFPITAVQYQDIFISKLDSSGNFVWAKTMGGNDYDQGMSIALDNSGNVYSTGAFVDTVDFDPGTGTYNLIASGIDDVFVSKLSSSGNFIWAKKMGGTGEDFAKSIAIDTAGAGAVYTTGQFWGTSDFDPGIGTFTLFSGGGYYNNFISKLDSAGNFVWAKGTGGNDYDYGNSIAINTSGNVYLAGHFYSQSIAFGSNTLTNATTVGSDADIFIARLDNIITGEEHVQSNSGMLVYPNPATDYLTIALGGSNKKIQVAITDITGKIIYKIAVIETQKIEVNTKDFMNGVYIVQIQTPDFIETEKLVVAK